eukprot:TRINITY_DN7174_c0_g1_i17.p1 TRINITY_DN7174_c0_g1~~TRINITY_DN7174_c0_g1_i17.p1  ORF type:complete len:208 (-),score=12.93 TRINITY_DN7174_c0_g1_i17:242-865(-)
MMRWSDLVPQSISWWSFVIPVLPSVWILNHFYPIFCPFCQTFFREISTISIFNCFIFYLHAGKYPRFSALSHQAVDFIIATLKNLLSRKIDCELLEGIVSSLILRLIRRMCTSVESDVSPSILGTENSGFDAQSCVQHIIRKLGSEPFIGQRTMLLVSQKLCILSDYLLLMDPFDDAFPNNHCSMYMMSVRGVGEISCTSEEGTEPL